MPRRRRDKQQNAMAAGPARGQLCLKGRLWIEKQGQTYLSWGRVVLLERIDRLGSVSAAARSMEMSFAHAWKLVQEMNRLAAVPLVEKRTGGRGGGGAWLTPAGKEAVAEFWALVAEFQDWISRKQPAEPGVPARPSPRRSPK